MLTILRTHVLTVLSIAAVLGVALVTPASAQTGSHTTASGAHTISWSGDWTLADTHPMATGDELLNLTSAANSARLLVGFVPTGSDITALHDLAFSTSGVQIGATSPVSTGAYFNISSQLDVSLVDGQPAAVLTYRLANTPQGTDRFFVLISPAERLEAAIDAVQTEIAVDGSPIASGIDAVSLATAAAGVPVPTEAAPATEAPTVASTPLPTLVPTETISAASTPTDTTATEIPSPASTPTDGDGDAPPDLTTATETAEVGPTPAEATAEATAAPTQSTTDSLQPRGRLQPASTAPTEVSTPQPTETSVASPNDPRQRGRISTDASATATPGRETRTSSSSNTITDENYEYEVEFGPDWTAEQTTDGITLTSRQPRAAVYLSGTDGAGFSMTQGASTIQRIMNDSDQIQEFLGCTDSPSHAVCLMTDQDGDYRAVELIDIGEPYTVIAMAVFQDSDGLTTAQQLSVNGEPLFVGADELLAAAFGSAGGFASVSGVMWVKPE